MSIETIKQKLENAFPGAKVDCSIQHHNILVIIQDYILRQ